MSSRSYWLIALPTEGGRDKNIVYQEIKSRISSASNNYADVAQFPIPSLKIGTLDALVTQSEELAKLDGVFEGVVNKIADVLKNVLQGQEDKLKEQQKVDGKHVDVYLKSFEWSTIKYRIDKSLHELIDSLGKEMASLDEDVRTKYLSWNQARGTYTSLQRKQTGNLSQRSLAGMVTEDDFVTNSEYLETMLVAVPKTIQKDWWKKYETLSKMVVPRSSKKLAEDEDYILVSVTLFKKFAAEFAHKCREAKFQPREFTWDAMSGRDELKEIEKAGTLERKLWGETLRLAKMSFSDAFQAWIHLKAIRVFVESVLRYGLPPDFVSAVVKPYPKQESKTRTTLNRAYAYLGEPKFAKISKKQGSEDEAQSGLGEYGAVVEGEYSAFVVFEAALSNSIIL